MILSQMSITIKTHVLKSQSDFMLQTALWQVSSGKKWHQTQNRDLLYQIQKILRKLAAQREYSLKEVHLH